ncbi:MAG: AAA family ATPase [Chloroflexi bacterium CFX4]|nr:AAA family ATPase [Chloroflexi bacterium CFX4]MDL1922714.1 AAA family ATPase [Chloroflexi bacterium CFX3]
MATAATLTTEKEVCPICKGTGLVREDVPVGHPNFGKLFPCVCQQATYRAREVSRLRTLGNLEAYTHKTFASFEVDYSLLEPEEGYLRGIFRDLSEARRSSLNEAQRRAAKAAAEIALHYAEMPEGWLLFEGSYGTGKTHLAAAIANHAIERGAPVLFITTPDLLDHLRGAFGPSSETAYDELFERIRKASLLVVDDLGAESPTAWAIEKLYQLFNDRHRYRLPTVITTNRDPAQIEPRIRSRLLDQDLTRSVRLILPDRRSPVLTWAEADLTDLSRYREMTFETFDLREGEGLPEESLRRLQGTAQAAYSYAENPQGWLVLTGRPGSGKTHLAAAIAHLLNAEQPTALFVTAADLVNHLRATFYPGATISYDRRLQELKGAPVLILDDLSIEDRNMSVWARDKLYEILLHRFDYNLPTVITSLQPLEEMDARLRSRLSNRARCVVEAIIVPSYQGAARPRRVPPPRSRRA